MNGCPLLVVKPLTPSLCREARASGEGQEHKGRKSEAVRRRQRAGGPREAPVLCFWTRDVLDQVLRPQRASRGQRAGGQQTPGRCSSSCQRLHRAAVSGQVGWSEAPPGVRLKAPRVRSPDWLQMLPEPQQRHLATGRKEGRK